MEACEAAGPADRYEAPVTPGDVVETFVDPYGLLPGVAVAAVLDRAALTAVPDAHDPISFSRLVRSIPDLEIYLAPSCKPGLSGSRRCQIVYSNGSLVAAHALDARILASAPATSR